MTGPTTDQQETMVLWLATGCGGFSSAANNWACCGTGHDHLRAMGLKLIICMKTIRCAVTLEALEPWIFRIFDYNVDAARYFSKREFCFEVSSGESETKS